MMKPSVRREAGAWEGRPRAAALLRGVTWLLPITVSVLATWLVSKSLPPVENTVERVLLWLLLSLIATGVLLAVDRVARRLLPLAALLKLSLVFPDQAPSRFRTALRTGTVRQLQDRVEHIKEHGFDPDEVKAAEELLELIAALSAHDRLTRGHAERVRAYSRMIGEELKLPEDDLDKLHWAGLLHDVGKLFVPAEILNKTGRLTDEEFEVIKGHPGWGADLCEPLRPWLGYWVDAVGQHHERWDGGGYPNGLAGADISVAARIVSVADVFDVITSVRSYKAPMSAVDGRMELTRCAGTQFDPDVVRAFLTVGLGRLRLVMGPLSWLAQLPVIGRIPVGPAIGAAGSAAATALAILTGGLLHDPEPAPVTAAVASAPAEAELATESTPVADLPEVPAPEPEADLPKAPSGVLPVPSEPAIPADTPPEPDANPTDPDPAPTPNLTSPPLPPPPAAPTAVDDIATVAEDGSVVIPVLANDSDGDGDALTVASTGSADGTASTDGASVTYTPAPDATGTHTVSYTIDDGTGRTDNAAITVTVTPVNDAPTFTAGSDVTVAEDFGPATVAGWATGITSGPADESGQAVTFTVTPADPNLFDVAPTIDATGALTFTPAANASGSTTVSVQAVDDGGTIGGGVDTSAAHVLTLTVTPVADAPVAGDDAYATPVAIPLLVPAPGVLANDGDEDGDTLTASLTIDAGGGIVLLLPDGSFTYTPLPLFSGTDTFTYTVTDGVLTDTATVTIQVDSTSTQSTLYLGNSGSGPDDWGFVTSPPAGTGTEADTDDDGNPGLTLKKSNQKITNQEGREYQHWGIVTPTNLVLDGPASLQLWSSSQGFHPDHDNDYSVWLEDCAADGTGCVIIASSLNVHVDQWNGGVEDWVYREIVLGDVSHTVAAGRMLQLRVMTEHNDLWIASSAAHPSALVITQP